MDHRAVAGYEIDTNPARIDVDVVHSFLSQSYWAKGIPRLVVERSIAGSMVWGLYHGQRQVGFARVISDRATFAYLADVFVLDEHQGRGLAQWLVATILAHPELQGLRRFLLATLDAHKLYEKIGFSPTAHPERWMEIVVPDIYTRLA